MIKEDANFGCISGCSYTIYCTVPRSCEDSQILSALQSSKVSSFNAPSMLVYVARIVGSVAGKTDSRIGGKDGIRATRSKCP